MRADDGALSDTVRELRRRRDVLIEGLNSLRGVSCIMPDGAFYAFADVTKTGMSSDEYSDWLLNETGVCVLPGGCFGDFGRDYVRLCYASTTVAMIEEALEKMNQFHKKIRPATVIKEYAHKRKETGTVLDSGLIKELPDRA